MQRSLQVQLQPLAVELAWVVCTFALHLCGFSPGTLVSSNSPERCTLGWLANLNCQSVREWFFYIWPGDKLATCLDDTLSSRINSQNRLQCTHHPERGRDAGPQNGWMDFNIFRIGFDYCSSQGCAALFFTFFILYTFGQAGPLN